MDCHYCRTYNRKFYCCHCLTDKLRDHKAELTSITAEKSKAIEGAQQWLANTTDRHHLQVEKHRRARNLDHLTSQRRSLRQECEEMTCKIDALRARIKQRQMAVSSGDERLKVGISDQADWSKELHRLTTQWYRIHKSTVATRRVLVNEVVSLFDVKQGRIEDDEGEQTAMYHSICNLKLPSRPVDLTRCAKEPINAAVELIVHALLLFVRYLGIKLPFRLFYQQAHLYVRPSTIWKYAKEKMPLFLDDDRDYRKFILGVAMLNYNLAYLCHLQGVVVSMEQLADTLSLLSLCCRAPRLGIKSHATLHRGVRDLDCPLDFQQVVKITASRYWCGSPKKDALNAHVASIYDHFFSKRRRSNHTPTFDLTASRVGDTSDDDDEYENGEDDDDDEHWNLVDNVPIPSISTSPISTYRLFPSFQ